MTITAWYADFCRRTGFDGLPVEPAPPGICQCCRTRRVSRGMSESAVRARKKGCCHRCYCNGGKKR